MFIFECTMNTRPLISGSVKYIRSDVPTRVSEGEREALLSAGITTVIDLRTEAEREKKPCPLATDGAFVYHAIPLTNGDKIPGSVGEVSQSYIGMVDDNFRRVMDILLNCDGGALYFCSAGKDRTGVVSAALLYRLGYPIEYIVSNYLESAVALRPFVAAFLKERPDVDVEVITPRASYITEFIDWYKKNEN